MRSTPPSDLRGRTVVITRAPGQSGALAERLEARGAEVVRLPVIRIEPPASWASLDRALSSGERYDAMLIGSVNAARFVAERAHQLGRTFDGLIACVGAKTEQAIDETPELSRVLRGERIVPDAFRSEGLVAALEARFAGAGGLSGKRFLLPRAPEGRELLHDELTARGATVDVCEAYRIVPAELDEAAMVRAEAADAITFLSGETLRAFLEVAGETRARRLLERMIVAMIGPVAAEKARALGVRVDVVPRSAAVEALVEALAEGLGPSLLAEPGQL